MLILYVVTDSEAPVRHPRILVADDNPQVLELLTLLLEQEYQVVGTAADGRALLSAAQKLRPDIILTDVDMPILNGIEAVREIHKLQPDCCVIFHSSHGEQHIVTKTYEVGASGYLIKGASPSLLSEIGTIVRRLCKPPEVTTAAPSAAQTTAVNNGAPALAIASTD